MGSILSKVIGSFIGTQPCESFLKDFPKNIGKLSLPSVVLDGLGLTCSGGNRSGPLINFAGNVTSLIMLYIGNRNVGFLKTLGKMIPKLFTSDEATNATIAEYLVINIVLFFFDAVLADRKSVYDAKTPAEAVQNCLSDLIGCTKDAIAYMGELKSPTCAQGLDTDTGLCYKPCAPGSHGVGPVCWADNPPASEGWSYDGVEGASAFIHNNYARPQHWQIDLPTPKGAKRTAACTMDWGPMSTYTNCYDKRITDASYGADLSAHFGPTARKTAICSVMTGGPETNCEKYGQGCEEGYEKIGSMCYEKAKPNYNCDLLRCYKTCPPGWTSSGIGCMINSDGRGVGTLPSQCPKGYTWDGVAACGPTDEYMRRLKEGKDPAGNDTSDGSWIPWVVGGGLAAVGVAYFALRKK